MRNRFSSILWGALLISLGVALLGGVMDWWDFDLFFDGWWTLFIIIPCGMSMVQSGVHTGNTVGLLVGIVLLLREQDILPVGVHRLILPVGLVIVGITLLFRRPWQPPEGPVPRQYEPGPSGGTGQAPYTAPAGQRRGGPSPDIFALFSGSSACFTGCAFTGGNATAIFGGAELDLRGAVITQDVTVTATAVFGGVDVFVDDRVQVRYSSVPILGGVGCEIGPRDPALPVVFVNCVAVFGGVEIK